MISTSALVTLSIQSLNSWIIFADAIAMIVSFKKKLREVMLSAYMSLISSTSYKISVFWSLECSVFCHETSRFWPKDCLKKLSVKTQAMSQIKMRVIKKLLALKRLLVRRQLLPKFVTFGTSNCLTNRTNTIFANGRELWKKLKLKRWTKLQRKPPKLTIRKYHLFWTRLTNLRGKNLNRNWRTKLFWLTMEKTSTRSNTTSFRKKLDFFCILISS